MDRQQLAAVNVFRRNVLLKEKGVIESVSGFGSSLKSAGVAIQLISDIITQFNITSISDCPCGDFHWMSRVNLRGVSYTGYDVVEELICQNQNNFGKHRFHLFNAITQVLPPCDLIICRDFLFHLHFADGIKVLQNFRKSGSKLLLTTSFNGLRVNDDLLPDSVYGFRRINVIIHPYNLGEPILSANEFGDRHLNLYRL